MTQKFTFIRINRFRTENINQELQWLGNSLGLFNLRDKDSSCFRIFIILVKKAKYNEAVSSDEIAEKLSLTRGTVVHHLIKLMEAGIVVHEKEGYRLRENNLQNLVKNIHQDLENIFAEISRTAREIDERLG
jgi:predicted transcriptional regulator